MGPTDLLLLHALRLTGYAPTARIADRLGLPESEAHEHLLDAQAHGWAAWTDHLGAAGWSPTEAGKAHGERLLAAELDAAGARPAVRAVHADFLPLNTTVAEACTAWQLTEMNIGPATTTVPDTIARLSPAADALSGLERRLTAHLPRFSGYHQRFASALHRAASDPAWITATDRDSAHRVWFELHEDLIATLGLTR